jgi:hypothetical protein
VGVEVLAQDAEGGEVIRVTVAGDQPKANPGQAVRFEAPEAIAWNNNGTGGLDSVPRPSTPLRTKPPICSRVARSR